MCNCDNPMAHQHQDLNLELSALQEEKALFPEVRMEHWLQVLSQRKSPLKLFLPSPFQELGELLPHLTPIGRRKGCWGHVMSLGLWLGGRKWTNRARC